MATRVSPLVSADPIVKEALERWQRCSEAEDSQRTRMMLAKQFRAGDQWEPAIRTAREGKNGLQGQAPQPPRPCLTIDRLSQPVRQISNQIKTADFAITTVPQAGGADQATAEIYDGYLRRVQNQARAESPVEWAADGAIEGGIGWFRIRTEYVQESPDSKSADIEVFDQELRMERIANNLTVYCDPSANKPTRSDALFMFVTEDLSKEEFKRRWPRAQMDSLEAFSATGDTAGWVTEDEIRIAEYWRIVFMDETWAALPDGRVMPVPDRKAAEKIGATAIRVVRRPKVEGYKINACEVLEPMAWVGSRIPLVPILGEELNVDGKPVLRGIIEEGMDAQRMVNYTYSGAVEIFALGSKAPYIAAAGQVSPYNDLWQNANTYNYSWLPYDPISINGTVLPPPQKAQTEAPIQAAVELMRISEEGIKATTGYYASGLGDHSSRAVSGRAKQAEIQQSELSASNYGDNVARALIYAGEIMVEVLPKITRPGQILHILGLDDIPEQVMVGQPFQPGKNGGPPQAIRLPDGMDPRQMQDGIAQFYDLTRGRYAVTVKVGKASATKREEGAAALGDLIPHLPPEMAAVATPSYVEQLDFPGAHQIAEKLKKALPPQLQDQDEKDGQLPPQIVAQIQQMQQMLQEAAKKLESKEIERQGELQKAQISADAQIQKANIDADKEMALQVMKNATSIAVAHISAASKGASLDAHAEEEAAALGSDMIQAHADRQHEAQMAQMEHEQALEQGEQAHGQALEQGQQAAALAPQPEPSANA